MGSLKIGMVLDDGLDKPDGVQQYILTVGEWLRSQGHEVEYLVGETTRTDLKHVHSMSRNIHVRFNGNALSMPLPTAKSKLKKFLDKHHFDVLHVQVPYSPFMAQPLILSASRKTAVVGSFHIAPNSPIVTLGTKALGIWLRPSLKHFDTMLSVSSAAADFAQQTFGMTSSISPNVIEYDRFHKAKPLPKYNEDTVTILFLGRLVPRKGCQLLLEAVKLLQQRENLPDYRVVICGKGQLQTKLQNYINTHKLQRRVEMVGYVSEADKPRYYASADISVFPSSGGESFGIVLLEAMASGRAVVLGGDNPGYRSVLEPNPQLLFDPRNAEALAEKLATYLLDAKLRKQEQNWGGHYVKQFDVELVGKQLIGIYAQALQKRSEV